MPENNPYIDNSSTTIYSVEIAAKRFGVSTRMIRKLIYERKLPFVRIGRRIGISNHALEQFIQDRTITAFDANKVSREINL